MERDLRRERERRLEEKEPREPAAVRPFEVSESSPVREGRLEGACDGRREGACGGASPVVVTEGAFVSEGRRERTRERRATSFWEFRRARCWEARR